MTPEQISAMMAGGGQGTPLSTYTAGITSTNPYYQPIVNTYNAGQGLTNWGAGASPEAISQGTSAYNANRSALAGLMAQAQAWRPPAPPQQQMPWQDYGYRGLNSGGMYYGSNMFGGGRTGSSGGSYGGRSYGYGGNTGSSGRSGGLY